MAVELMQFSCWPGVAADILSWEDSTSEGITASVRSYSVQVSDIERPTAAASAYRSQDLTLPWPCLTYEVLHL